MISAQAQTRTARAGVRGERNVRPTPPSVFIDDCSPPAPAVPALSRSLSQVLCAVVVLDNDHRGSHSLHSRLPLTVSLDAKNVSERARGETRRRPRPSALSKVMFHSL